MASALRGFLEGAYQVRAARSEDEVLEAVSSFEADRALKKVEEVVAEGIKQIDQVIAAKEKDILEV